MRVLPPALALALALALGCAGMPGGRAPVAASPAQPRWAFFETAPRDLWLHKIADWQSRQRREAPALAGRPEMPLLRPPRWALLRDQSQAFEGRERRALAARIADYSQREARRHYRWDPDTDLGDDPWPTSRELYERNGDDCDGLDLIAYDLLLAFGFPEKELYRVIVRRERDGANHMATLWFETPDDPWVIDATGAITRSVRRFSDLRGWTPLRVFDDDEAFGVAAR